MHSAPLDTGILQALCVCQMGRYDPPERPEDQVIIKGGWYKRLVHIKNESFGVMDPRLRGDGAYLYWYNND